MPKLFVSVLSFITFCFLGIPQSDAQANVRKFDVLYSIPVDPSESALHAVSKFEISDYQIVLVDEALGKVEMEYTLPKMLLGYDHNVRLFLVNRSETEMSVVREFAGRDASAKCFGAWDKMKCDVKFWVKPDLLKLEDFLTRNRDPRIADRLEISRRFGNDPIGITEVQ